MLGRLLGRNRRVRAAPDDGKRREVFPHLGAHLQTLANHGTGQRRNPEDDRVLACLKDLRLGIVVDVLHDDRDRIAAIVRNRRHGEKRKRKTVVVRFEPRTRVEENNASVRGGWLRARGFMVHSDHFLQWIDTDRNIGWRDQGRKCSLDSIRGSKYLYLLALWVIRERCYTAFFEV